MSDTPRQVLMDKSLRQYAQDLVRDTCAAWSDVVDGPYQGLNKAKCDFAVANEARLRAVIDELADKLTAANKRAEASEKRVAELEAKLEADRVVYLIERQESGRPVWFDANCFWVSNALDALWFARRSDAEANAAESNDAIVTEHLFIDAAMNNQPASKPEGL
jgi:hypothetical protein